MNALGSFGGFHIVVDPNWPRIDTGKTEKARSPAHPHLVWLIERFRWLPSSWAWFEYRAKVYREADPIIDARRGIIHCGPVVYDQLRRGNMISTQGGPR